jgi:hypothetical protein
VTEVKRGNAMKRLFTVFVLASAALAACHGKKPGTTTPTSNDKAPLERKSDSTGGAAYGGHKSDAGDKTAPNPGAAH